MNLINQYQPQERRYESMPYRTVGRSGLKLPAISLGLWQNFGFDVPLSVVRSILHTAFDHGITHFDLANNYGPPYGSAEIQFGQVFQRDFRPFRDEMIISTKAGYDMWPGPYGNGGSRKYLLSSSIRVCHGCNWTMSISFIRIVWILRRHWRKPWGL